MWGQIGPKFIAKYPQIITTSCDVQFSGLICSKTKGVFCIRISSLFIIKFSFECEKETLMSCTLTAFQMMWNSFYMQNDCCTNITNIFFLLLLNSIEFSTICNENYVVLRTYLYFETMQISTKPLFPSVICYKLIVLNSIAYRFVCIYSIFVGYALRKFVFGS